MLNESSLAVMRAIIFYGETSIGQIARHTGMHRQSARIVIKGLLEKGFIEGKTVGNKYFYMISDLDKVRKSYIDSLDGLKKILPRLKSMYEEKKDTQTINSMSGRFGIRTVLVDEIIKGKEIFAFHLFNIRDDFKNEFIANDKRRVEHNIFLKILSNDVLEKYPLSDVRKIDRKGNSNIFVYANKVSIVYNDEELKIFTLKIDEITKYFKGYFDSCWNSHD
jgi:sugar-specific transcriptional regulator TrmB